MTQPAHENIISDLLSSFRLKYSKITCLDSPWHFHDDFELFYIIRGHGKRFVGDNISGFTDHDMVFMASRLPHLWKNPDEYYLPGKTEENIEAICLQFLENAFGEGFFDIPEMSAVKRLMQLAQHGILIKGDACRQIASLLNEMLIASPIKKFTMFIRVLDIISTSSETELIATKAFTNSYYHPAQERMQKVFQYISKNFRTDITLQSVAGQAGMSIAGFCRHFRQTTLKSFVEYLNEIKVNYACSLLKEDALSVTQICYESGFKNLSYFNRVFKSKVKLTPSEYRKSFS
jgi:AraC-like DNA-binding protein